MTSISAKHDRQRYHSDDRTIDVKAVAMLSCHVVIIFIAAVLLWT